MDTSRYRALFLQEAEEHIKGIREGLLRLEKEPGDPAPADNLFRHFHSIKGMAASMGYKNLASFSHQLEDILSLLRQREIAVNREIIDMLLEGSDILQMFINMIAEDKPIEIDTSGLLSRIQTILTKKKEIPPLSPQAGLSAVRTLQAGTLEEAQKLSLPATMKVNGRVFDDLMAAAGELFTVSFRLSKITTRIYPVEFHEALHHLGRTTEDIYQTVIKARMIPFEYLCQNLPRIVRDMCKRDGKDVDIIINGGEVRLDRSVLEQMTDPLIHIIRNAIDHGIETPDERVKLGKAAKGRVTISVARQRDNITIEIADDGKGIDIKQLKEKGLESGISGENLKNMKDEEILLLICLPGLSLAKEISETSGRGVGMDVVKKNIESIGGRLKISSYPKKGTKIILEFPATISIIKVLLVSLGDELFALPLSKVLKVLDVDTQSIHYEKIPPYFIYNDTEVPLADMRHVLMMPHIEKRDFLPVVMIDAKDKTSGIIVDDFEGEIDAYIKPLSTPMSSMKGITGVTVLGDGRPVCLLDPTALFCDLRENRFKIGSQGQGV